MQISWKHDDTYLAGQPTLDRRIDVFEARMWGWQLHVADLIINGGQGHAGNARIEPLPHAAFAALQVALVYFEAIAKYEAGYTGKESRKYFIDGLLSVFPKVATLPSKSTERLLNSLYEGARCGLYHMSMTAPGIALARTGQALSFSDMPPTIVIDPHVLIPELKIHFGKYIARLRDPTESTLRRNFVKCFEHSGG